eukprot:13694485-Ditylum_brightwellii.AAC.1
MHNDANYYTKHHPPSHHKVTRPWHILKGFNLAKNWQPVFNPTSVQWCVNELRNPTYISTHNPRSVTHAKVPVAPVTPLTLHLAVGNLIQLTLNRFM